MSAKAFVNATGPFSDRSGNLQIPAFIRGFG